MESLAEKGAAQLVDGETRAWSAVSYEEFTALRMREISDAASVIRSELADIDTTRKDDRVYEMKSVAGVLERASQMIRNATVMVVADLFPAFAQALRPDLVAASERDVRVGVRVYGSEKIGGCVQEFRAEQSERIRNDYLGEMFALVTDSNEYLVAHVSPDMEHVQQAIYTASPYLAMMATNGIACEMIMGEMTQAHEKGELSPTENLARAMKFHDWLDAKYTPGRNRLSITDRTSRA